MPEHGAVLLYARPWSNQEMCEIATAAADGRQLVRLSEHPSVDHGGLVPRFYQNLAATFLTTDLSDEEIYDVISRCRLLRHTEFRKSVHLVKAMSAAIDQILDTYPVNLVITHTVDSYVVDLIRIRAERRRIPVVGLVPSFLNGYTRVTARGAHEKIREVPGDEVSRVQALVTDEAYRPAYIVDQSRKLPLKVMRRWLANLVRPAYFRAKRLYKRDPENFHYNASICTSRACQSPLPFIGLSPTGRPPKHPNVPRVFVPLQFTPEATVDYWANNIDLVDYERTLLRSLESLTERAYVIIKEHPAMYGNRPLEFYKSLRKIKGVYIADINESSNDLISETEATMVYTGTAGFEAAIRDKPVLSVCEPYYAAGSNFYLNVDVERMGPTALDAIERHSDREGRDEKFALFEHVLQNVLPVPFRAGIFFDPSREDHVSDARRLGRYVADFC